MRAIDADVLIEKCGDWYVEEGTESGFIGTLKNLLVTQPTVTPEPHWIPVTENCDCDLMDNEEVLVCQKDGQIRHAMFYDYGDKKTFVTWEEGITIYNVLAYMPLPEPYKEVTE